jgi:hypothetical protein
MQPGKLILLLGLMLVAIGAALTWAPWLVNWFGKLPGDICYEKNGSGFYFPVVSMLLISLALTLLMNWLGRH